MKRRKGYSLLAAVCLTSSALNGIDYVAANITNLLIRDFFILAWSENFTITHFDFDACRGELRITTIVNERHIGIVASLSAIAAHLA